MKGFLSHFLIRVLLVISSYFLVGFASVKTETNQFKKSKKKKISHDHNLMDYIIKHNNAAVAVHDNDLKYIFVSEQYLKQYRVKESDIIGKHHYEVFPDIPQKWRDIHQKTLEGNVFSNDRDQFIRSDGTIDYTRWETRPWYQEDGSVGGLIVYTEVINDQLKIEAQLQRQAQALTLQKNLSEATLMAIGDGVISTDEKGRITAFNPISESITGWSVKEAIGTPFDAVFNIVNEHTRANVDSPVGRVLKSKQRVDLENHTILITKTGHECYIEDSATPINDENGDLLGVVLVFRDVSNRVALSQKLNLEKQRLSRAMESTADIIFEINKDKRFVSVYGKGLSKIHHQPEDFENKTVLEVFGEAGKERDHAYSDAIKGKTRTYDWEYSIDGETIYFESSISPMFDDEDNIVGAVGITRDITEAIKKQKDIEYLSFHDHLSGLHNRRYFSEKLAKLDNEMYYPLGVIMIDLNGLKILNDAYGHDVGDTALKSTSDVLLKTCPKAAVVARIGGDEFAIVIANTDEREIEQIENSITDNITQKKVNHVSLSVAIGHDIKHTTQTSIGEIIKNAENRMYKRKLIDGIGARNNTIRAILQTLTDKYKDEKIHAQRVSDLCKKIGRHMGLSRVEVSSLGMAGMFHDIGKISIPDAILEKTSKLTEEEYTIIKAHTESGYQILRAADEYSDLAEHALYHHERIDGLGYPRGLKGNAIPLQSRIICVADAYEAMTSNRPYRKALSESEAIAELKKHAGTQFDKKIVTIFIKKVLS